MIFSTGSNFGALSIAADNEDLTRLCRVHYQISPNSAIDPPNAGYDLSC